MLVMQIIAYQKYRQQLHDFHVPLWVELVLYFHGTGAEIGSKPFN